MYDILTTMIFGLLGFVIGFVGTKLVTSAYKKHKSKDFQNWFNSLSPEERAEYDEILHDRLEDK